MLLRVHVRDLVGFQELVLVSYMCREGKKRHRNVFSCWRLLLWEIFLHELISIDFYGKQVDISSHFLVLTSIKEQLRLPREILFFLSFSFLIPLLMYVVLRLHLNCLHFSFITALFPVDFVFSFLKECRLGVLAGYLSLFTFTILGYDKLR